MRILSGARRRPAAAAVLAVAASTLAACGGDSSSGGPPTLGFYNNNPVQVTIANRCAEESGNAYQINPISLPSSAGGQREQLLRRLAAGDTTIDVVSLDPPFMAEFANAGFLRPFTDAEREEFSEGVLEGPLEQAIFDDQMWSAPFYGNTQLLWYKKSVAAEAGLDPAAGPVTWDQLIDAAEATGTTLAEQGTRNESLMVWVNALVESAGGSIIDPATLTAEAQDVKPAIDSQAGAEAARIMSRLGNSSAAIASFSTANEEDSRAAFQAENGGFLVNWPYVWSAFDAGIEAGTLTPDFKEDVAWAQFPRVSADLESAPPSGGIGLSIGAFSNNPDAAVDLIRCLRNLEGQKEYMVAQGDPGAAEALYDDPDIQQQFPMYEAIRDGLNNAVPRTVSPYYGDITTGIQRTYHPPSDLSPDRTPGETAALLKGVLSGSQLL